MGERTAHVAASRRASVIPRGVIGATKTILAATGHAIAWVVLFSVVPLAIADFDSGFVGVFVVVEAHLAGFEIGRDAGVIGKWGK